MEYVEERLVQEWGHQRLRRYRKRTVVRRSLHWHQAGIVLADRARAESSPRRGSIAARGASHYNNKLAFTCSAFVLPIISA
jgi:hypothetical protein